MRYCGRDSQQHGIERIDQLLQQPRIHRARLSRELRERLNWRRANGRLKDMSCRVALLRMQADGLIRLPPPRNVKPVAFKVHPEIEHAVSEPTRTPRIDLARIDLEPIVKKPDSLLWNAYLERYHYLKCQPMPGARLCYFVRSNDQIIAALGFGASAWKVKPHDPLIGRTPEQRQRHLHLVVNNPASLSCRGSA